MGEGEGEDEEEAMALRESECASGFRRLRGAFSLTPSKKMREVASPSASVVYDTAVYCASLPASIAMLHTASIPNTATLATTDSL